MTIIAIFAALLLVLVLMVGGAFSPALIILGVAALSAFLVVRRAKQRRGSSTQL